jgi:hypothetical protein
MKADPFAALGLPAQPELSDDEVRAAWRRVAAATHPDRDDGGDPAAFAAAAAAYTELRTVTGRREAWADRPGRRRRRRGWVRRGRPVALIMRLAVAAAVIAGAVLAAGPAPATYAVIAGALTWLLRTARRELAAPGDGAVRAGKRVS